ncbi:MAG TPA: NADH-quinone oxidoreductase subunit L [Chitinophagales bacterium]|nr:NADH-quinone oxidoreductase subunit L [Chitinophagales bacterium]HMZ89126.1 NADH-quinone oxidoreductase subunit L [Chitinophagales bacterium]HNE44549.1 NADH-quinone oxidoreductase subunit L [Chitinophagales bacterium]HNI53439.1 NADH-quinone oxidoreductase subunit L [Chitinophagales bacterium]HNJ88405.1 NADH-quinone oxidoreductase subunit L [Chitinophagales bacterium]
MSQNALNLITLLIPALPLLGFVIHILFRDKISEKIAGYHATAWIVISFVCSLILFNHVRSEGAIHVQLFEWFSAGDLSIPFAFQVDQLSVIMLLVITGIGSLIHMYSIGYMHGDDGFNRFFSYLNLFIFFMLTLVMANNYVLMFVGWEGVGLCSYLLIGFWFKNPEYNKAANKAFIMNRIGDLAMLLGLFLLYQYAGTLTFDGVSARFDPSSPDYFAPDTHMVTAITMLLFIGACGKSAQIPLYTWLPDAMAGPTPVSALIHAATMVTAGIYMIVRSNLMFSEAELTMQVITVVGIVTSIFAGAIALKQNDIKKVLAYSTVSQLGLMFFAIGVGAYEAAMFHLVTHAFFKALLFLSAGSVIHGMGGEQDIRKMGGLRSYMKVTHWVFGFGVLAIMAVPPFSGFFSKDTILAAAYVKSPVLWVIGLVSGLFTAYYMMRLYAVVFQGQPRMSEHTKAHIHESPSVMTIPLMVLCALSIVGGLMNIPELFGGNKSMMHFLEGVVPIHEHHVAVSTEWMLMAIASVAIFLVIFIAHRKYRINWVVPESDAEMSGAGKVLNHKFYVDELYEMAIVKPMHMLSNFFYKIIDLKVIDGVVNGTAQFTTWCAGQLRLIQTGTVSFYLFMMALGMGAIVLFIYLM